MILPSNLTANYSQVIGWNSGTSLFTSFTCGANNTKGSWAEITSSCPFDVGLIAIYLQAVLGVSQEKYTLLDIGIGSSGNEVVLIPNISYMHMTYNSANNNTHEDVRYIHIPLNIAAGQRISIRGQTNHTATMGKYAGLFLYPLSHLTTPSFSKITDYGTNTSTSRGVTVDTGATANTKSSWTQITASTTRRIKSMIPQFASGQNAPFGRSYIDIGIGGAGSEVVVIPDIYIRATGPNGSTRVLAPNGMTNLYPFDIPTGTRIAARGQNDGNIIRYIDVSILGLE